MKETTLPSLYVVNWVCRALIEYARPGSDINCWSEMMPIVRSKIYVNTQTKILALNIKILQVRKLNHRKDNKRKYKWFILIRSLWPTSSPQATRLRFSFNLWLYTPKINTLYTTWQIPFSKCIQLFLQTKKTQHLAQPLFNPKTLLYNLSLWVNTINPISLESVCDCEQGLL